MATTDTKNTTRKSTGSARTAPATDSNGSSNNDCSGYTIGLDLGDKKHAVCVLDREGRIACEEEITNTRECLTAFSRRFPGAVIAMETGTHSPWISRLFQQLGHRVVVANARKLAAIASNERKSDRNDARLLARLCRADESLLHPVTHRSEACQRSLVQIKARHALVRSRVSLMTATRFLLKSLGIVTPSSVKATAFPRRMRTVLDDATRPLVDPMLRGIEALNAQIKTLDKTLEQLAAVAHPQAARLAAIPGVGPLTALCFVLTLESPQRFPDPRQVGAYLGLVPRRDQSGDSDKKLPITKAGNVQLRCLLVNCAHYILGRFGPPCDLRSAGERMIARGGAHAKKRAVIAIARKLSVTMMALWKSGSDYRPLRDAPPPSPAPAPLAA